MPDPLSLFNAAVALGLIVVGFFALRNRYSKEAGQAQERLIGALEKEVASLRREVEDLTRERNTQDGVISTIRHLLLQKGWKILINGEFVSLIDKAGKSTGTRIQAREVSEDETES